MSYEGTLSTRSRIAPLAKGLGASLAIAALLGGIPYGLCRFVGWPLPRRVPSWHAIGTALSQRGISDTALIDVLAIALWCCWAVLALAFVVEGVALVRYRSVGRLPLAGRLQPLAGVLLGAAVLTFASLFARTGGSGAGVARAAITLPVRPPPPAARGLRVELTAAFRASTLPLAENGTAADAATTNGAMTNGAVTNSVLADRAVTTASDRTYVVRDDDTLWGIAERELGDPTRWQAIFDLNRGVPQKGGGALDNPHWIYPGWVLRLPAPAPSPSTVQPSTVSPSTVPSPAPVRHATAPSATSEPVPSPVPARPDGPVAPGSSVAPGRAEPTDVTPGHTQGAQGPRSGQTGNTQDHSAAERAIVLSPSERVGGGLVVAVLGALVALRLRRRQRYRPRTPRPGRDLRRPALESTLADLLAARSQRIDDEDASFEMPPERVPLSVVPEEAARATPGQIEVAIGDDGSAVELSLSDWPGLVLAGAGGEATLRAWCAALVARDGPYNVEIVTTTTCAARLVAGLDLGPALSEQADAAAVVARVEATCVGRARSLERNDCEDAASYRSRYPEDPLPLVVALLDALPADLAGRWRVLCDSASHYGTAVLMLDADDQAHGGQSASLLVVDADGYVRHATPGALAVMFNGRRCCQLGASAGSDLLAPIVAVQNDAPIEVAIDLAGENADEEPDALGDGDAVVVMASNAPTSAWPAPRALSPVLPIPLHEPRTTVGEQQPPAVLVRVRLLGPTRIEAFGVVVKRHLRTSAVALLAWFALRPDGATRDAAADALYPGASHDNGRDLFWTALGNLRSLLGKPQGSEGDPLELIGKIGDRYVPDAVVLDVDLWHFEAALGDAASANDPVAKAAALDRALAHYGGNFCPGLDDLWCAVAREDLRRRALDAATCLAGLTEQQDDPAASIAAWERVVALDPLAEASSRSLAALLATSGRLPEAIAVGRRLTRNLDAIELEPSIETNAFFAELRARQRRIDERRARGEGQG